MDSLHSIFRQGVEQSLAFSFLNNGLGGQIDVPDSSSDEAMLALSGNLLVDLPFSTGIRLSRKEELEALHYIIRCQSNYGYYAVSQSSAMELQYNEDGVAWFSIRYYTNLVAAWLRKIGITFWIECDNKSHTMDHLEDDDTIPF